MKVIHKSLVFVTALLLAAFALPSNAATKQFSISVAQLASTSWKLTYTNGTQGGATNSNINSVSFVPPFAVSNVAVQASLVTSNTLISPSSCATSAGCAAGTTISITYMNGIPPGGGTGYVTMNGTAPNTAAVCTSGLTWSAQAFTGNALGGMNFFSGGSTTATTTSSIACVLQFVTQPGNAQISTNITSTGGAPVQVQAIVGGSVATWFNGSVSLQVNDVPPTTSTPTLTGSPVTASSGIATFGDSTPGSPNALTLNALGTYTLTASASGFTPATSNAFSIFNGVLNCEPSPPFNFGGDGVTDPSQSGYAAGLRWFWNKDGVSCVQLLYTFLNNILGTADNTIPANTVHLMWDKSTNQLPAFTYSMTWRAEDVDNPNKTGSLGSTNYGWPVPKRPMVAWNSDNYGQATFVPALSCADPNLPEPYGLLDAAITDTQTTIVVDAPTSPPVPTYTNSQNQTVSYPTLALKSSMKNFAIVIGTERMLVTQVAGSSYPFTLTVTRGAGGTTKAAHTGGVYVMSTPLPLDPSTGVQVPICVVNHGWMSAGVNPATGIPQIRWFTTVYDIGDSWVQQP